MALWADIVIRRDNEPIIRVVLQADQYGGYKVPTDCDVWLDEENRWLGFTFDPMTWKRVPYSMG